MGRLSLRWRLAAAGVLLPALATLVVEALDERIADVLMVPLLMLYGVVSAPGLLIPLQGLWTLAFESLVWGAVGFFLGRRADRRRATRTNPRD
jgi:hypothetical protein